MTTPARLPDAVSLETVLAGLDPVSADTDLVPALTAAFPGFAFGIAPIADNYWCDIRSVLRPDGTRVGELRPWMTAELAKENGDVKPVWQRLKETDLQITEWRGTSASCRRRPDWAQPTVFRSLLAGKSSGASVRSSSGSRSLKA